MANFVKRLTSFNDSLGYLEVIQFSQIPGLQSLPGPKLRLSLNPEFFLTSGFSCNPQKSVYNKKKNKQKADINRKKI